MPTAAMPIKPFDRKTILDGHGPGAHACCEQMCISSIELHRPYQTLR